MQIIAFYGQIYVSTVSYMCATMAEARTKERFSLVTSLSCLKKTLKAIYNCNDLPPVGAIILKPKQIYLTNMQLMLGNNSITNVAQPPETTRAIIHLKCLTLITA